MSTARGMGPHAQPAHLLSNGRYSVLVTDGGGGYSAFQGSALTRWAPDPVRDDGAVVLYVRDVDTGNFWSAGRGPARRAPDAYEARFRPGGAELVRRDGDLETATGIAVAREDDVEVRLTTIRNGGSRTRRLDLTTYVEVVLDSPAAAAAHPAFSRLFVQTAWLPDLGGLLAWRRPRSPQEEPLWLGHRLEVEGAGARWPEPGSPEEADGGARAEYETDRARFLGRGRTTDHPVALDPDGRLCGTTGSVLDPAFALRRVVAVAPGQAVRVAAVLSAGRSRHEVEALLRHYGEPLAAAAVLREATPAPDSAFASLGLPRSWRDSVRVETASRTVRDAPRDGGEAGGRAGADGGGAGGADADWASPGREPLLFFNGTGGFSQDGSEYVIRLVPGRAGPVRPPLPWINVVANDELGFLASESGAGYTWSVDSRHNRLTPWSNDPVSDPHGEALYVRDEETGAFWSPTPGPVPGEGPHEVRHGFGYTVYRHRGRGLEHEVVQFVPARDPVKIVRVALTNRGERPRRVSVFSYAEWVLGGHPAATRGRIATERDAGSGALVARNPQRGDFGAHVAFAHALSLEGGGTVVRSSADRAAFLGCRGSVADPEAVRAGGALDGRTGTAPSPCAAHQVSAEIPAGGTFACVFLLGEAEDLAAARRVLARYREGAEVDRALAEVRTEWGRLLTTVQVETPSPALDLMINGWLLYQTLSCRLRARSALYQSGGAFGFRDQIQDASALVHAAPERTRAQILLHAAHQFVEGDVLHWWHPPRGRGIRTRFSDDALWLPYLTASYVRTTGDASVLDERVAFLVAPALEEGQDEAPVEPRDSGERASVYEHCCRVLDRSLTRGPHGLPLMGSGDWNDGMNRVGRLGRGESVWLGFFLYRVLGDFLSFCEERHDAGRVERYRAHRAHLEEALDDAGWDGAWYRRAYYDDGTPLGSAQGEECRIDAIAQAWAVLSGAAPPERASLALDALEEHLVSEDEGIVRLLTPPFDRTSHDPGYIKGYVPGIRENGGQYTHAALWAVRALAEAGRTERAAPLLEMLSPVSHARTPEEASVYRVEPYVVAADVYGVAPHVGRGGWTWYTGSAGWMYRVALESVLGIEVRDGRTLAVKPCIPRGWPGFRVRWRMPDGATTYELEVSRPAEEDGASTATEAWLDGEPLDVEGGSALVPLARDGSTHRVEVALGSDVGPRYRPSRASPLDRITSE